MVAVSSGRMGPLWMGLKLLSILLLFTGSKAAVFVMPDRFDAKPNWADYFSILGGIGEATTTVMYNDSYLNGIDTVIAKIGANNIVVGGNGYFDHHSLTTITANGQTSIIENTAAGLVVAETFTYSCTYIDSGATTNSVFCLYGDTALVSSTTWNVWFETVNVDLKIPGSITVSGTTVPEVPTHTTQPLTPTGVALPSSVAPSTGSDGLPSSISSLAGSPDPSESLGQSNTGFDNLGSLAGPTGTTQTLGNLPAGPDDPSTGSSSSNTIPGAPSDTPQSAPSGDRPQNSGVTSTVIGAAVGSGVGAILLLLLIIIILRRRRMENMRVKEKRNRLSDEVSILALSDTTPGTPAPMTVHQFVTAARLKRDRKGTEATSSGGVVQDPSPGPSQTPSESRNATTTEPVDPEDVDALRSVTIARAIFNHSNSRVETSRRQNSMPLIDTAVSSNGGSHGPGMDAELAGVILNALREFRPPTGVSEDADSEGAPPEYRSEEGGLEIL